VAKSIPRSFIDQVIANTDIVSLIDRHVPLKKMGASFKACCPFHQEKTPSFVVSADKQIYHCFGCGVGGNAISFLMEYEHLSFVETVATLAKLANMTLPEGSDFEPPAKQQAIEACYQAMSMAVDFYEQQLQKPIASKAKAYLSKRGLSQDIIAKYRLGFAPPGWRHLESAAKYKIKPNTWVNAGLIIQKNPNTHYDRFRERIIFPIRDRQGRAVGIGGRIVDQGEPKYLNSPETPIFHKGTLLYGFYELITQHRSPEYILVVEGYMDVLALVQQDISQVVGTLGTATTEQHITHLFRYTDRVVFCFDGDEAGQKAAWRALTLALPAYQDGKTLQFMFLPTGEDPDSFVQKNGKMGFLQQMSSAQTLSEYFFQHLSQGLSLQRMDDRATLVKRCEPLLKTLPESHLKTLMVNELASRARIDSATLALAGNTPVDLPSNPSLSEPKEITPLRHAISILLQHPALVAQLSTDALKTPFEQVFLGKLLEFIQKHPKISTAGLLEAWRDQPYYTKLVELANRPLLIEEPGLLQELQDTLIVLSKAEIEQRVDSLMQKAKNNQLSLEEKQELQTLLAGNN